MIGFGPMPLVSCNFAAVLYDRMVPLATNQVPVPGLSINFINVSQPREIFDRMTGSQEFDASELSASEHIVRHISGDQDFVAIPVFPLRSFRHRDIYINTDRISKASDLNGKRVGVPLYTMTAAVWIRGLLQHEYGVDLSTIDWIEGSMEKPGLHGNKPSVLPPLPPVRVSPNKDPRRGLSALLEAGELDAIIGAHTPLCLGSSQAPQVQRLFPDFQDVEIAYYRRTGIFPIMHVVALRRGFYERNRFAASALYSALEQSKETAKKAMEKASGGSVMLPWLPDHVDEVREVFGGDCWPYGLEPNRKVLEALTQYLYEQSMVEKTVRIEDMFVPVIKAS